MKIKSQSVPVLVVKPFEPLKLEITLETEAEVQALRALYGSSGGRTIGKDLYEYENGRRMWNDAYSVLQKVASECEAHLFKEGKRIIVG